MKYLILVPDGCADRPIPALGGKTPLEAANPRCVNALARVGEVGLVRTIPDGVAPGSDAANLSVMGFDPKTCLTGRSPLEAVSMGIEMAETDMAFRTNLVTLEGDGAYDDLIVRDHSAGDISSEEARELIECVNAKLGGGDLTFWPGVSYRHALIMRNGADADAYELTPPHDILTKRVGDHLPRGRDGARIERLMRESRALLRDHPVNAARRRRGLNTADSIWIWGQGRRPKLPSFFETYGIAGTVISAVDLIKGIGICAGLEAINIPGATGTLLTNFEGKAAGAIAAFERGRDFVYVHVEAPDECSHQGDADAKIEAVRRTDEAVLAPIAAYLARGGEPYRILVLPDHATPTALRTHAPEPVPYVLYDSERPAAPDEARVFSEAAGARGVFCESGRALADRFFGNAGNAE